MILPPLDHRQIAEALRVVTGILMERRPEITIHRESTERGITDLIHGLLGDLVQLFLVGRGHELLELGIDRLEKGQTM